MKNWIDQKPKSWSVNRLLDDLNELSHLIWKQKILNTYERESMYIRVQPKKTSLVVKEVPLSLHRSWMGEVSAVAGKTEACLEFTVARYLFWQVRRATVPGGSLLCVCWKRYRRNGKGMQCGNHRFPQSGHVACDGEKRTVLCLHDLNIYICLYGISRDNSQFLWYLN